MSSLYTFHVVEITPEGEAFDTGRIITTSEIDADDLLPLLKHLTILPKRLPAQRVSCDLNQGTWTVSVRDVAGEREGFLPVLKLVPSSALAETLTEPP